MINFFQYEINKKYLKYFLILGWVSIWASLAFDPSEIDLFFDYINFEYIASFGIFELFNISRGLFQIFYLILLFLITFILLKSHKVFLKSNIIFLLFLTLFLIETLSLFFSDNLNVNFFFVICSFNTILTVFLLKNFFSESDLILTFKLSIIFLLFLLFFFGTNYFLSAYKSGINIYGAWGNIYGAWGNISKNVIVEVPRPTGLSRTALFIFIFLSNITFLKKSFNKINYVIILYSIVLLILLSSRTTTFIYILYILFYIFYFKIFKIRSLLSFLAKYFITPLFFVLIIGILQNINIYYKKIDPSFTSDKIFSFKTKNTLRIYPNMAEDHDAEFSSGRISDWKDILNSNERKFFGNGVLGDRYLIGQSASNLLFYTYASSGIIGLFIIICIALIILFYTWKEIFINKLKFNNYRFSASIILISLLMRSILESSFGVFGIDFILFCLCFALIIPKNNSYESN